MIVGKHVIADFLLTPAWRTHAPAWSLMLYGVDYLEACLRLNNATIIDVKYHQFEGGGGVTAIFLLAESHLSVHTWPEHDGFCVDIFTCGNEVCPVMVLEKIKKDLDKVLAQTSVTILDRYIPQAINNIFEHKD